MVLYASSQVDNKKVPQISAAIQGGFEQMGVFREPPRPHRPGGECASLRQRALPVCLVRRLTRVVHDLSGKSRGWSRRAVSGSFACGEVKRQSSKEVLGKELRDHHVDLRLIPGGLVVSLREIGFFNSGEAVLLPQAEPTWLTSPRR